MIAAERPFSIAVVKNAALTSSLDGRPNETLETPSEVLHPSCSVIFLTVSSVVTADILSALTVIANGSNIISFLLIPYKAAVRRIFLAIFILPSTVDGIPFSSSVSATTNPPYFLTRGKIAFMLSSLPLTEFIIALPLYRRSALSIATGSDESICNGRSVTH